MICPRCHGKGNRYSFDGRLGKWVFTRCHYPGCHNGYIHCCEGDKEQEDG